MSGAPRTVLIADDAIVIGVLLARTMRPLGLTPIIVTNGADAIAAAQRYATDLAAAFLDIEMPGITGIDAAITIHRLMPHLPIVLMSAGAPAHLTASVAHLPLTGVLQKPFTIQEVRTLLAQLGLTGTTP
jgi:CheY-like chemotaxis protein